MQQPSMQQVVVVIGGGSSCDCDSDSDIGLFRLHESAFNDPKHDLHDALHYLNARLVLSEIQVNHLQLKTSYHP
jgi:hypothetical protein